MPNPIVALDLQNEKLTNNSVFAQLPQSSQLKAAALLDVSTELATSARPTTRLRDKDNRFNLLIKPSWPYFLLVVFLGLGAIGLVPFFLFKPDRCGRFSFGLTLYQIGETQAEYDGQCVDRLPDQSAINSIAHGTSEGGR